MASLASRRAGDPANPAVMLVHGYPESSLMWQPALDALAARGLYAVAPDLAGFGDSPPDSPGTWERQVEALERFRAEQGLERLALVGHDWGGLIGLRWLLDHGEERVWALVASATGFFADGRWHGMGEAMRTPGQGEELVDGMTRESFGGLLASVSRIGPDAVDEYFKAFADEPRRRSQLELYRSGDFDKLAVYDGRLAALQVPALLLWGEDDPFAPLRAAERLGAELQDSRLEVIPGTGHFVFDDAPDAAAGVLADFLRDRAG